MIDLSTKELFDLAVQTEPLNLYHKQVFPNGKIKEEARFVDSSHAVYEKEPNGDWVKTQ